MYVLGGRCGLGACPKCHLAFIGSVKHISFDTGSCLIRPSDTVRGVPHELRKGIHAGACYRNERVVEFLLRGHHYNSQLALTFQLDKSSLYKLMRHLMPIITPRLILRPPTLGDLDSIQIAKEEAWHDLQRWMTWAFENQRSRQAMEDSIRRGMDYQNQLGIPLAGFHRVNGDFVVRTALDVTDEQGVYETGYWVAPKYTGQGMATEATNAAIRYAFGHLGAKAISIGYFDGNEPSRRIVEKLGFQKLRVAHNAATRCLDGAKLDRHEYVLTSPNALPELDVSWG
jgi:RimJ/RimL family protein N-acetyltransferase